jgi:hypothetical protein
MHAMLEAENGITFMAADTPKGMEYRPGASISMSLSGDSEKELSSYFPSSRRAARSQCPRKRRPGVIHSGCARIDVVLFRATIVAAVSIPRTATYRRKTARY